MIYVLDTNTVVARLRGDEGVSARLKKLTPEEAVLTAPVLAELEFGAWNSQRRQENLERVRVLQAVMRFEAFGRTAAGLFGQLKASLRRQGVTKNDFDLAIAAIAIDLGAVLVSDDHAFHDGLLEGLKVENWLRDRSH